MPASAAALLDALVSQRVTFLTGVPCSTLGSLLHVAQASHEVQYLTAAGEGMSIALAVGAWLGGTHSAVVMQNSGLGNAVNPLATLAWPYRVPLILICSWRGEPGRCDEPQHELMGHVTPRLLELLTAGLTLFTDQEDPRRLVARAAEEAHCRQMPAALLLPADVLETVSSSNLGPLAPVPSESPTPPLDLRAGGQNPTRYEALQALRAALPCTAVVISTTGMTSRELFAIGDGPQCFYQVGSMGYAGVLGLGVALHSTRATVVVDGDGAALMHLGALAMIGAAGPRDFVHVVLDNGTYDSTGGQPSLSSSVSFESVAAACGYPKAIICDSVEVLADAVARASSGLGPTFVRVVVRPGNMPGIGRPDLSPPALARRFRGFVLRDEHAQRGGSTFSAARRAPVGDVRTSSRPPHR